MASQSLPSGDAKSAAPTSEPSAAFTPFAAGYMDAIRAELPPEAALAPFAPEALAMILADCERADGLVSDENGLSEAGISFWDARQWGYLCNLGLRPLTVSLGDDGKVRLAGQS